MKRSMTCRRLSAYEQLMRQSPDRGYDWREDLLCRSCPRHRPNWAYRFCVYTECPHMKGMKTFWEDTYDKEGYAQSLRR